MLAQALQPGSYISFETALSFHGWIPESVPVTMSVPHGRRRLEVNHAMLGLFRFYPLALRQGHLLEAVDRHAFAGQTALVAQPLRALLDTACLRKLEVAEMKTLAESMRIDAEMLAHLEPGAWQTLQRVYSHQRMRAGIQSLQQEMAG